MPQPGAQASVRTRARGQPAGRRASSLLWLGACLVVLALWPLPPRAEEASSRVVAVIDGDTLRIDPPVDGLDEVRLAGIEAVKPPLAARRIGHGRWRCRPT